MKSKEFADLSIISKAEINQAERIALEDNKSDLNLKNADDYLEKRISECNGNAVAFDSPEKSKEYADLAFKRMNEYREYMRQANTLESDIRTKRQPESRKTEVLSLRKKAEAAKREAEKFSRYAKMELNQL